jgi:pyrimidine deaminase RibD-like protein
VTNQSGGDGENHMNHEDERRFAALAIEEAAKSQDEDQSKAHPRVGAVVVKNGDIMGVAHRGHEAPGDHAEYSVLEKVLGTFDVSGATLYTTLEPCTYRNPPKLPCVQHLLDRQISRVVIGMLDPNQRIRGQGVWTLVKHNVAVALFDPDQARSLMDMNRLFTREQEGAELKITSPADGFTAEADEVVVHGTHRNIPRACIFLRRDVMYYPQGRYTPKSDGTWECTVTMKKPGSFEILATELSEDLRMMVDLYHEVAKTHQSWMGRRMTTLPPGLRVHDRIDIVRK